MDLHARAVDRDPQRSVWLTLRDLHLQFAPLELGEDLLQEAIVDPSASAHVNRVFGIKPVGQGTPGTIFLGHEQPTFQHLSRGHLPFPREVGVNGAIRAQCASDK